MGRWPAITSSGWMVRERRQGGRVHSWRSSEKWLLVFWAGGEAQVEPEEPVQEAFLYLLVLSWAVSAQREELRTVRVKEEDHQAFSGSGVVGGNCQAEILILPREHQIGRLRPSAQPRFRQNEGISQLYSC
jgi:hypothetical protein